MKKGSNREPKSAQVRRVPEYQEKRPLLFLHFLRRWCPACNAACEVRAGGVVMRDLRLLPVLKRAQDRRQQRLSRKKGAGESSEVAGSRTAPLGGGHVLPGFGLPISP